MFNMLLKFGLVGLSGVGVNMGIYVTALSFGFSYISAAVMGFLLAVTSNFFLNMVWTFKGRAANRSTRHKYTTFMLISVVNLGVNLLLLRVFVEFIGLGQTFSQLLAIGAVSVLNFGANYAITFKEPSPQQLKETVSPYETDYNSNV